MNKVIVKARTLFNTYNDSYKSEYTYIMFYLSPAGFTSRMCSVVRTLVNK